MTNYFALPEAEGSTSKYCTAMGSNVAVWSRKDPNPVEAKKLHGGTTSVKIVERVSTTPDGKNAGSSPLPGCVTTLAGPHTTSHPKGGS